MPKSRTSRYRYPTIMITAQSAHAQSNFGIKTNSEKIWNRYLLFTNKKYALKQKYGSK